MILSACAAAEAAGPQAVALVKAARSQIGVTTIYDASYQKLAYPGGDVPVERGVCCDVIVRALRTQNVDLQKLVHEDMAKNFSRYPRLWRLTRPDSNIDHRRVPNLMTFFTRSGKSLPVSAKPRDYHPGDIVTWKLSGSGLHHIGIVSDRNATSGAPLIIHNIGAGTQEEDILFQHRITGHYRYFTD